MKRLTCVLHRCVVEDLSVADVYNSDSGLSYRTEQHVVVDCCVMQNYAMVERYIVDVNVMVDFVSYRITVLWLTCIVMDSCVEVDCCIVQKNHTITDFSSI